MQQVASPPIRVVDWRLSPVTSDRMPEGAPLPLIENPSESQAYHHRKYVHTVTRLSSVHVLWCCVEGAHKGGGRVQRAGSS